MYNAFSITVAFVVYWVLRAFFPWLKHFEMLAQPWIIAGIYFVFHKIHQDINKGTVLDTGIDSSKGLIPFGTIQRIEGNLDMFNVIVPHNSLDIALRRSDLLVILHNGFKQWSINGSYIKIFRSKPEDGIDIQYAPISKYSGSISFRMWLFWGPLIAWLFGWLGFVTVVALGVVYLIVLRQKKKYVKVSLEDKGINYKDEISEGFIAYTQIEKTETKRYKLLLFLKDGRIVCIPRELPMIEELVMRLTCNN